MGIKGIFFSFFRCKWMLDLSIYEISRLYSIVLRILCNVAACGSVATKCFSGRGLFFKWDIYLFILMIFCPLTLLHFASIWQNSYCRILKFISIVILWTIQYQSRTNSSFWSIEDGLDWWKPFLLEKCKAHSYIHNTGKQNKKDVHSFWGHKYLNEKPFSPIRSSFPTILGFWGDFWGLRENFSDF